MPVVGSQHAPIDVQVSGAVHVALTQAGSHTGVEQSAPVQPRVHVQVSGAVHVPLTQAGSHTGVEQSAPVQPESHVQVSVAVHVPLTHGGLQTGPSCTVTVPRMPENTWGSQM